MRICLGKGRPFCLIAFALAACLISEALHQSGALATIDSRLQDFWFQWQGKRAEPQHVAIVVLDEDTLSAYPDDPMVFWTNRYALAISRLREAGVKVIGLDMLLSISPERWLSKLGGELQEAARSYDQPFREQLNSGQLILAATRQGKGSRETDYLLPSPDYLLALPDFDIPGHVALADLLDEDDGVVRRYRIAPVEQDARSALEGDVPIYGLPALMAIRAAGENPRSTRWQIAGRELTLNQAAVPIPYIGPPGSFQPISLKRVLADNALEDAGVLALRNKVVLIGASAALNDEHFTPYAARLLSGRGSLMNGVELHANVLESLLSGYRLQPLDDTSRIVVLVLLTTVAALAFGAIPAWAGATLWLAHSGLLVTAGFLAFEAGLLIPVSEFGLAMAISLLSVLGWRLTGEERERTRIRQIFSRYVSSQVVKELLESGKSLELGGQTQSMTVLFSDIRNFTTISERLEAREVVEMLNTYFERACAPLQAAGGSIDKFIGDAIMVEFGSPLPVEDHAQRGVKAAIALSKVAEEFSDWMNARFPDRNLPKFAVGIGLHSGEAVIGNIGSPTRMEFTAIGDTVNLASRLEGMTKEIGCVILASKSTIDAAGDIVNCGRSSEIKVKGRDEAVRVFEVLGIQKGD